MIVLNGSAAGFCSFSDASFKFLVVLIFLIAANFLE